MPTLHVLRVFVNEDGEWGNPLGVFLSGAEVPEADRRRIAAELGFSETVFVEDRQSGRIRIFTPAIELPFAGHPTVGAAWLLAREGAAPASLLTAAGEVDCRVEDGSAYVAGRPEWCPSFEYVELDDPARVRALDGPPGGSGAVYAWAWIDEDAGTLRARCFVEEAGIPEDEATGSAAIPLCARIGRPLTVHQGHGSVLTARPLGDGRVEVGGAVRLEELREQPL